MRNSVDYTLRPFNAEGPIEKRRLVAREGNGWKPLQHTLRTFSFVKLGAANIVAAAMGILLAALDVLPANKNIEVFALAAGAAIVGVISLIADRWRPF